MNADSGYTLHCCRIKVKCLLMLGNCIVTLKELHVWFMLKSVELFSLEKQKGGVLRDTKLLPFRSANLAVLFEKLVLD